MTDDELKARAIRLRGVVQKCAEALGNDAFVGREASDDFHALVPSEIGLHVASLVEDRDTWQERAKAAEARAERAEKERDNMQLVAETYEAKFREWADRAEKAEAALEIMRKLIKDVRRLSSIEYAPEESLMSILREQIDAVLAQKETGRDF